VTAGVQAVDWAAVSPVVAPAVALLLVLVVEAVRPGRRRVLDALSLAGLSASGLAVALLGAAPRGTFCASVGEATVCSYRVSGLTSGIQAVVVLSAITCLLLALDGPGARARAEHHVLLLTATTGALALAGSRDLATLVVSLETAALPVVALVALRRDATGAQAALKLLLVQVASLGVLLLGLALVYVGYGTLHLELLAGEPRQGAEPLVALGAALAVAGVAFKLSAVPFGYWTPDVYAGSPVPVAAFLSTVSKAAGLAALLLVLVVGLGAHVASWAPLVAVLAGVSMTVGNLVALRQRRAVRLLAWSTVAQAGWVVLPLAGAAAGLGGAQRAAAASVAYLLSYVVATLAAFAVVLLVTRHHVDGAGHDLEAYRGLARREPVAAAVLAFALACLAGLPPGVMGLVAKVVALRPVVDAGVWVVAVVAAVNVALGLAYYLRWGALLLAQPEEGAEAVTWSVTTAEGVALGATAAGCVVLSAAPQLLLAVAGNASG
jgi:NADH-quinone oxidoreductase subunit N